MALGFVATQAWVLGQQATEGGESRVLRVGHPGESGYRVTVELWDLGRESWGTIPHPSLEHRGGFTIVAITPLSARAPARVARGLS